MENKVNIKLRHDGVLVKPFDAENKTAAGIIIPDSAQAKPTRGVIILVGPGTKDDPMDLKVGEIAIYRRQSGTPLTEGGIEYVLMSEREIMATLPAKKQETTQTKKNGSKHHQSTNKKGQAAIDGKGAEGAGGN
jgi:chaperonin GroES